VSRRWTPQELAEVQCRMVNNRGEMGPTMTLSVPVTHAPKPAKYRNVKVTADGIKFDSKLEARCYEGLKLRKQAGDVKWFIRQVPFELEGGVTYRADFLAVTLHNDVEVIDATGRMTPGKLNKLRQVHARYGVGVILWTDKKAKAA
jgi:hypothetical protein